MLADSAKLLQCSSIPSLSDAALQEVGVVHFRRRSQRWLPNDNLLSFGTTIHFSLPALIDGIALLRIQIEVEGGDALVRASEFGSSCFSVE